MREPAGREKDAHDGTSGGDPQTDAEHADRPFAVGGKIAAASGGVTLRHAEQKEQIKQHDGRDFVQAADRHLKGHDQRGTADDQREGKHKASDPPVQARDTLSLIHI